MTLIYRFGWFAASAALLITGLQIIALLILPKEGVVDFLFQSTHGAGVLLGAVVPGAALLAIGLAGISIDERRKRGSWVPALIAIASLLLLGVETVLIHRSVAFPL